MFKKTFKLFWAWQDEAEGQWLRNMAQQGWGLQRYSFGLYTFEKIEPTDYIYKLDYKSTRNNDIEEYISIFEDTGWEHVEQFLGWHYFRLKADRPNHTPDIYSDINSKIQKYKVLSHIMLSVMMFLMVIFVTILAHNTSPAAGFFRVLYIVFIGFSMFGFLRLRRKMNKFKHNHL